MILADEIADLEHYAKITGTDLSGPVPDDPYEAVQKKRAEQEAKDAETAQKFGANGRDLVPDTAPAGKGKKGKKNVYVEPEPEHEVEEEESEDDEEEIARQAANDREIAEAEEAERLQEEVMAKAGKA